MRRRAASGPAAASTARRPASVAWLPAADQDARTPRAWPSPCTSARAAIGKPASTLSARSSCSWPRSAASGETRAAAATARPGFSGICRSICQRPLIRCGPRAHAVSAALGHQGSGSNWFSSPSPARRQTSWLPARCRCAFSVACALASPALARSCVSSTVSAVAANLNCACSWLGRSRPACRRARRRRAPARARWSLVAFGAGALALRATGSGTPLSCRFNAPLARSGGALACKRAGSTSVSCNCSCSSLPAHWPRPCTRPGVPALVGEASRRAAGSRCDRACFGVPPSVELDSRAPACGRCPSARVQVLHAQRCLRGAVEAGTLHVGLRVDAGARCRAAERRQVESAGRQLQRCQRPIGERRDACQHVERRCIGVALIAVQAGAHHEVSERAFGADGGLPRGAAHRLGLQLQHQRQRGRGADARIGAELQAIVAQRQALDAMLGAVVVAQLDAALHVEPRRRVVELQFGHRHRVDAQRERPMQRRRRRCWACSRAAT